MSPELLDFEQQLDRFIERGMLTEDVFRNKNVKKLETIGYYRLKEFAKPFATKKKLSSGEVHLEYNGVKFNDVVVRYYLDKNLRINMLHAIEKIEVSIKTHLAYILGDRYGAFGYLSFSKWANKLRYSKYDLLEKEYYFKKNLRKSISKTTLDDAKYKKNQDNEGFPSVWIGINILMFGELVNLIELLPKDDLNKLSDKYDCRRDELVSWLKTLNFIRNVCAHNSNVIDIKLTTRPRYRRRWSIYLFQIEMETDNKYIFTNRVAVVLLIIKHFLTRINPKYGWKDIHHSLESLSGKNDQNSYRLGFKDYKSLKEFTRVKVL